jgi:molybdate transport system substrate-binding protein
LEAAHLIDKDGWMILAENHLTAIGVPACADSVHRPRDLLKPEVSSLALAVPECPLGGYSRSFLDRLELYDALQTRIVWGDNSRAVLTAVQSGQAQAGLVYSSDAVRAEGCRILFNVPQMPVPICYAGAVLCRGGDLAPARALLQFLTTPEASRCFRQYGFRPVKKG